MGEMAATDKRDSLYQARGVGSIVKRQLRRLCGIDGAFRSGFLAIALVPLFLVPLDPRGEVGKSDRR